MRQERAIPGFDSTSIVGLCRGQRGSALIVSLVMLLLITLIGIGAVQTNTLQQRMAANMHDQDLAFQAAEAALRDAEAWLATNTPVMTNANGLYDLNNPNRPTWPAMPINDGNGARQYSGAILGVDSPPRYYIESIGTFFPPGTSLNAANSPPPVAFYRITALGIGGSPDAVSVVRSVFRSN